ncbi:MAG: hypothetical protein WA921_05030 [Ahrensia sp.]
MQPHSPRLRIYQLAHVDKRRPEHSFDTPRTEKNDFELPAHMPLDKAVDRVIDGFERGGFETPFLRRYN